MKTTFYSESQLSPAKTSSTRPPSDPSELPCKQRTQARPASSTVPALRGECPPSYEAASPVAAKITWQTARQTQAPESAATARNLTRSGTELYSPPFDAAEGLLFLVLIGTSILCITQNAASTAGWFRTLPMLLEFFEGLAG